MMIQRFFLYLPLMFLFACAGKQQVDTLYINGTIYTVDSQFSKKEAVAVAEGKIIATGTSAALQQQYIAKEVIDLKGAFVYPGFIDAHAHFYRYGLGLRECNLVGTTSWEAVLAKLDTFARNAAPGQWIIGRGWDQNDWEDKGSPVNELLNQKFAANPVLLTRIDGHAAIANDMALQQAGITAVTRLTGGDVILFNNKPTGLLIDNAIDLVTKVITPPTEEEVRQALLAAQINCFAAGLTTVVDCGLDYEQVEQLERAYASGDLKLRLYVMLSDAAKNYEAIFKRGKIKTDRLQVRSFKVYADGALGSRGASLLHPYSDRPGHYGFLLSNPAHFDSVAALIYSKGFQMCTHAIGDSGNRTILNIYAKYLKQANDLRWRIEHAQVVNSADFDLFGNYNIIPSVQPTHATSDMYWAGQRLGPEREKGAYAFKQLLQQNGWIPLGTDFPVEDIDPLKTFRAAVFRQDEKGWPQNGYQAENALSRQEAIRGMTIWAAKASFEEQEKGSIEPGKFADFTILDQDLLAVTLQQLLQTKVIRTVCHNQTVYQQ